ncbi:hypothetical protein H5410_040541 [Solanum commersonii]|uniref:Uncharacterized protein n=1 Tax=Solanum commersonii TaxID=4109 RepID=A0A9J5XP51_SOLCO|nr:hypothetical protein H5410_040541 [Solanum commersonii]
MEEYFFINPKQFITHEWLQFTNSRLSRSKLLKEGYNFSIQVTNDMVCPTKSCYHASIQLC